MHAQVFAARPDVEPLTLIQNDSTDLRAFPHPFRQDRNERYLLTRRNPFEDGRIPDRDICVIEILLAARSFSNLKNTAVNKCYAGSQPGLAQAKGHVISAMRVFEQERIQIDISQNVAAVDDERLLA